MNKVKERGRRDRAPEKAGVDPEFAKRFLGRFEGSPVGMDTPLEVAFEAVFYRELSARVMEPSERESAVREAPETSNLASDTRAAEPVPRDLAAQIASHFGALSDMPDDRRESVLRKVIANVRDSSSDEYSVNVLYALAARGFSALSEAAAESNSPVENCQETSHNKLMLDRPNIGDAALEQRQSEFVRLAKEIGLATAGKLIVEAASPDERAHIASMAACVREVTSPEPPTPAPLAAALEAMTLKDRRAALIQHYGLLPDKDGKYALPDEKKWENVKGKNPTPEKFLAWLDVVFPDRREIGMVLSDLKHLDKSAYDKVMNWSAPNSGVSKAEIDSFGLPSKVTKYDPVRDANAPKSLAEVVARVERGEGSFKKLNRAFARVQQHVP